MSIRGAAILLLSGTILSPAQRMNDYLYPIREGKKLGLINRSGAIVVAPQYDGIGDSKEGRIQVTAGNLSGYIDLSGKVVIEPKYDSAGEFRESRAVVRQGDKYALIDPAGKPIAEIPYRVLGAFHQGLLRVQASGRVDASGHRLPTTYGFVDLNGKVASSLNSCPPENSPTIRTIFQSAAWITSSATSIAPGRSSSSFDGRALE